MKMKPQKEEEGVHKYFMNTESWGRFFFTFLFAGEETSLICLHCFSLKLSEAKEFHQFMKNYTPDQCVHIYNPMFLIATAPRYFILCLFP